ncbi:MAG: DUF5060 domain-containing protein [Planctomycetota bacterium]
MKTNTTLIPGLLLTIALGSPCHAGEAALELSVDGPAQVGRYEKIEFIIKTDTTGANPFDAADIDVSLEFTPPSGKTLVLPAFYAQPYERREVAGNKDWMYPSGLPGFRARFAPAEVGAYSCKAVRKDKRGVATSNTVAFESTASSRRGYLRVSTVDPRFLEFTDGTPFFAIGENLAFIGETQYMKLNKAEETFQKLAANGANFLRIWACCEDWAMAIEARKSAWGRSWGWKPPLVEVAGETPAVRAVQVGGPKAETVAVAPSHPVALKPGTRYELSALVKTEGEAAFAFNYNGKPLGDPVKSKDQWSELKREFTAAAEQWWAGAFSLQAKGGLAQMRKLSLQEAGGGPELLWEADTERPIRGYFNQPDCYMVDCLLQAAEKHGIFIELTFITRDLYMNTLSDEQKPEYTQAVEDAKRLLRYAVARWGWSPNVAMWEYFNEMDPGKPTNRAYREWGEYFEQVDIYHHLRATSAWGPSPKDWAHPKLDTADLHWYLRPAWGELSKDAAAAALDRAKFLREKAPQKPALLAEFGLADDKWGLSPYMNQDKAHLHFHDALWASALSGLSGTAMFWWWEQLDKNDAYGQYKPVAGFVADVPFAKAKLKPATVKSSAPHLRVVALQGQDCAYLWLSDARFTWWQVVIEKAVPAEVKDATVTVEGLEPGTYKVQWWDTQQGKTVKEETVQAAAGNATLAAPPFTRDVACKVVRADQK